jgi:hypothetical protein
VALGDREEVMLMIIQVEMVVLANMVEEVVVVLREMRVRRLIQERVGLA